MCVCFGGVNRLVVLVAVVEQFAVLHNYFFFGFFYLFLPLATLVGPLAWVVTMVVVEF